MLGTATTYEPINTLKPIAKNIWIVDGPLISFKHLPFTTRMIVIKLSSGDLFLHSPTPLTQSLKKEIDALGTVKHLVSPNRIHYWWVGEWAVAYPKATCWASPKVRPIANKHNIRFDIDLEDTTPLEWSRDIHQVIARGGRFMEEVIFFHKSSQTLIITDMIENFEAHKIPYWMRPLARLGGVISPNGSTPKDIRLTYFGHHEDMQKALNIMTSWNAQTIIMAHGKIITKDATQRLARAFAWV